MPEDHDRLRSRRFFGADERATKLGLNAKDRKEIGGDLLDLDLLRLAATRQVEACVPTGGDERKRAALFFPIEKVRRRNGILGASPAKTSFPDHDDAARIAIGEGAEQDGVNHTEDGGVCADAERERNNSGCREARRLS